MTGDPGFKGWKRRFERAVSNLNPVARGRLRDRNWPFRMCPPCVRSYLSRHRGTEAQSILAVNDLTQPVLVAQKPHGLLRFTDRARASQELCHLPGQKKCKSSS